MYRVAVIGAGIGAEHCAGLAKLPDLFEIAVVCDLDAARGAPVAETYKAGFSAELETVLADPTIDIVDVCLPPHLHFEVACRALNAGKHVVCEKPLVTSLRDADLLAKVARDMGKSVFPVFQYRFGLGMAQMRALIKAGLAGKCYAGSLETHWNRDAAYYAVPWRGTWAGEQGGALLGHAIHIHDMLCAILGPIDQAFAQTATRVNDIETEDCAALSIRTMDGAVITSSVTLGAATDTSRLRLMFEGVTVESDHAPYAPAAKAWTFQARGPGSQAKIDTVLAEIDPSEFGFTGFYRAVFDALQGDPNHAVTLADGRRSLEFVTGVYASARSGMPQSFPLNQNHALYGGWRPDGG